MRGRWAANDLKNLQDVINFSLFMFDSGFVSLH